MNLERIANKIAFEFPTKEELKQYLKEHPKADKSLHYVKETGTKTPTETPEASEAKREQIKEVIKDKVKEKIQEKVKEVKKKPESQFFPSKEIESLPDQASQKVNSEDEVYKQAEEAQSHMEEWLDKDKGIDKKIGARKAEMDKEGNIADFDTPGPVLIMAPLKGRARAKEKVTADYKGNWNRLTDTVRASIAVDSYEDMDGVVGTLKKSGMKLAQKPKDRFAKPTDVGYRDVLLNVEYPNGHVGELQLHVKPMIKAKAKAHKDYEVVRGIEAKAKLEGREKSLTDEEQNTIDEANERMKAIYEPAWSQSQHKKASENVMRRMRLSFTDVKYYEYHGNPAYLKRKSLPIQVVDGKEKVVDMFKFLHEADEISKQQYDKMMRDSSKKASVSLIVRIANKIAKDYLK